MPYHDFFWTDEIQEHIAEHGITREEFEEVVTNPERTDVSRSTGRPCCWGETADGRQLFCVYELLDETTIIPVTAYELSD